MSNPKTVSAKAIRKTIKLDKIVPDESQPRQEFNELELEELRQSALSHGIKYPPRVYELKDRPGFFGLIGGERRYRSMLACGAVEGDFNIEHQPPNEAMLIEEQLLDDLFQVKIFIGDKGRSFERLMELHKCDAEGLAGRFRINVSRITRALKIWGLPEKVREKIRKGKVSIEVGLELSRLADDPKKMKKVTEILETRNVSKWQARSLVEKQLKGSRTTRRKRGKGKKVHRFKVGSGERLNLVTKKELDQAERVARIEIALFEALKDVDLFNEKERKTLTRTQVIDLLEKLDEAPNLLVSQLGKEFEVAFRLLSFWVLQCLDSEDVEISQQTKEFLGLLDPKTRLALR